KARRVGGQRGDEPRLGDARGPQLEGTLVVAPDLPGDLPLDAVGNAERPLDPDAVAKHAPAVLLRAEAAQMRDHLGGGGSGRQLAHAYRSRRASSEEVSQRRPPMACTSL